jgi:hypothetical protein
MISMAIASPAQGADGCKFQLWPDGVLSPPKLLTVSVIVLAMGAGGCARNAPHAEPNPVQRQIKAAPVRPLPRARAHVEPPQHAELRVRRPDPALLAAQPAPNCEFKRADLRTVDPDEWARLKAEFERQCYQEAEKAARDRLSRLQASSTCEVERVRRERPVQ